MTVKQHHFLYYPLERVDEALANIDYTFGSVIDDSVEIPVTLGDSLAVQRTISPCNGNYCQFRPIVYSGSTEMVNFEGIISKLSIFVR